MRYLDIYHHWRTRTSPSRSADPPATRLGTCLRSQICSRQCPAACQPPTDPSTCPRWQSGTSLLCCAPQLVDLMQMTTNPTTAFQIFCTQWGHFLCRFKGSNASSHGFDRKIWLHACTTACTTFGEWNRVRTLATLLPLLPLPFIPEGAAREHALAMPAALTGGT